MTPLQTEQAFNSIVHNWKLYTFSLQMSSTEFDQVVGYIDISQELVAFICRMTDVILIKSCRITLIDFSTLEACFIIHGSFPNCSPSTSHQLETHNCQDDQRFFLVVRNFAVGNPSSVREDPDISTFNELGNLV